MKNYTPARKKVANRPGNNDHEYHTKNPIKALAYDHVTKGTKVDVSKLDEIDAVWFKYWVIRHKAGQAARKEVKEIEARRVLEQQNVAESVPDERDDQIAALTKQVAALTAMVNTQAEQVTAAPAPAPKKKAAPKKKSAPSAPVVDGTVANSQLADALQTLEAFGLIGK